MQTYLSSSLRSLSLRSNFTRRFLATGAVRLNHPLYFAESHEWYKVDADNRTCTIGVSDFAQKELGSIVYVDMPDPPMDVAKSDSVAAIECGDGKAVGEVYTPQDCEITEVNSALVDDPSIINADPYGKGWIVKVKFGEDFDPSSLMDKDKYEKYLETCERHH